MYKFHALELVKQVHFVKRFVFFTLTILILFIGLLFLPWQQTVKGIGRVTALNPTQRDYKVAATVDGFIDKFYVHENQFVKKGEPLFSMRDLDAEYQNKLENIKSQNQQKYENELIKLSYIKENIKTLANIIKKTKIIYKTKKKQLDNQLLYFREQLYTLSNKQAIEKKNYRRTQSLFAEGLESQRNLELNKNTYYNSVAQLKKIEIKIKNQKNSLKILNNEQMKFEDEMQLSINKSKEKMLEIENKAKSLKQNIQRNKITIARYKSRIMCAKSDGYVLQIYQNDKNKLIKKGEDILYFSPKVTKRAIRLKVADFHMPLMKKGLKARIIFYGWPAMQISGWPKISHGTYAGIIHSIERSAHENGAYYVVITEDPKSNPWPSTQNLKIGTQATVWIKLSVVTIWYEIWRLMMAQPPQMVTPVQEYK